VTVSVLTGDCLEVLADLEPKSVHCIVTSPPYWKARDYGHDLQFGQEKTVAEYVATLTYAFRLARECLRDDGTLWLNIGDCIRDDRQQLVPARVAVALLDDGWVGGHDNVWRKTRYVPVGGPRYPERTHEYVYLFAKSPGYHYDAEAIKEPLSAASITRMQNAYGSDRQAGAGALVNRIRTESVNTDRTHKHKGSVWDVCPASYDGAHFATFPPDLIEPCILAGCPEGGTVLDPFGGAGTTGLVADRLQRNAVLIELNPQYADMARERITKDAGMFADVTA
jgi:DNA modification methylase